MNDFKGEPAALREAMIGAVRRVLESGWYVLGPELKAFEMQWAAICKTGHAVGVGNGMDAIEIGLRSLDIGPGDEVITSPMTAFATVLAILRSGATPILADINPDTALLSIDSVRRCITSKTRAIVLVHLYGQIFGMEDWQHLCKSHDLCLIEDCAQSHLASWNGQVAGSFGRLGAYSFYPTKNLGAPGDAGMLVTNEPLLAERASRLRNYGQSVRYEHPVLGLNSRLDEIQAAMLLERLQFLSAFTKRRQDIAVRYHQGIENSLVHTLERPIAPESHVYHLFVIRAQHRDALVDHLQAKGVQSLIHYPIPIHQQHPCEGLARDPEGLLMTELHASQCLSLPCHPQLSDQAVESVIYAVNTFRAV